MRFLTLALLWLLAAPAHAAEPLRLLVSFGTNQGLPAELPLRYAEADARSFAQTLNRLGDLPRENYRVIAGGTPTALSSALSEAAARARVHRGDVTFFFYFSGHGDDKNLHIDGERFPLERLRAELSAIPAKLRVSVIDACRSQGDTHAKGFSRAPAFAVNLKAPSGLKGVVTLRSSSGGEDSQESKQLQGAVFTHYFTTALRGAADRDQDNRVTLQEAYAYAYRQTVRRSARGPGDVMHPSVDLDVEGAGQLVLTRLAPADAVIVLPRARDAQFLVFETRSQGVEAEVWASPERGIPVRVPAGRYLVHRRDGAESGATTVAVRAGERRALRAGEFQQMPEQLLALKGGALQLFYQSLGAGYGARISHTGSYGQSVNLRYSLGGVYLAGSLGLNLGLVEHAYRADTRQERWFGGDLRLTRRRGIGPLDVFAGVSWRVVSQKVQRQADSRLAGTDAEIDRDFVGLAAGGGAGLSWSLPMGPHLGLLVEGGATLLAAKEGGRLVLRPEGGLELGVVTRF